MFTKLKTILTILGMSILLSAGVTLLCSAFNYDDIYENVNVWYKVSTDELDPGVLLALDMRQGYSICDNDLLYIIVNSVDSEEEIILAFPNGGYWSAPGIDTTSMEIQKIFGKLEQDLRK